MKLDYLSCCIFLNFTPIELFPVFVTLMMYEQTCLFLKTVESIISEVEITILSII